MAIYLTNYAELEDMITYSVLRKNKKYFTGKQIKEVVSKCIAGGESYNHSFSKNDLLKFDEKYIHSEYPLSDNKEYSIEWKIGNGMTDDELKCYKREVKDNKFNPSINWCWE